jgi:hypothetical protein
MSTPEPPPAPTTPQQPLTIKVVSHSGLVYCWPVWLAGFILAALTYFDGSRAAVVPGGTGVKEVESNKVYELTLPPGRPWPSLEQAAAKTARGREAFPVQMSHSKSYGVLYILVILLVLFGSNVPFRGLASIVAILVILLVACLFAYLDWWAAIFDYLGGLHIQITLAGYLLPSVVLLVLWLATFFLYDPLRYMIFTPGQFVLHKEIGDLRQVFDTAQVEVEKRRTDLFRYWVLGFGAGDLVIKVPSQALEIELPNVLFVAQRVTEIANLMKVKPVIRA